jgi:sulfonate transport system substrate-binding protein
MALVLSAGNVAAGNTAVGNAVQTGSRTASLPKEIRIGFQKSSVNLTLLKHRRALEQQLKGVKISWFEFTAGPQMLEALSVGSIDLQRQVNRRRFLHRRPVPLVYVGNEPAKPSAIL